MTEETPIKEKAGSTSNEKLKELLHNMRNNIQWERNSEQGRDKWGDGLEVWADELEELIND